MRYGYHVDILTPEIARRFISAIHEQAGQPLLVLPATRRRLEFEIRGLEQLACGHRLGDDPAIHITTAAEKAAEE